MHKDSVQTNGFFHKLKAILQKCLIGLNNEIDQLAAGAQYAFFKQPHPFLFTFMIITGTPFVGLFLSAMLPLPLAALILLVLVSVWLDEAFQKVIVTNEELIVRGLRTKKFFWGEIAGFDRIDRIVSDDNGYSSTSNDYFIRTNDGKKIYIGNSENRKSGLLCRLIWYKLSGKK